MRAIWTARNKRYHGETSMSITQACRWARDMASDLIQTSGPCAKGSNSIKVTKWQKPPAGLIKVNVDASFDYEGKQGATAVMIRDDMGQVIAIRCKWYNDISIVLSAEAPACRDGAELMASLK
ncbi:hypothetical protein BRADI_3g22765v3 [Brachypodium distachyon]|uniref:RNase H type-1 domain-containing protein n=1 Tax=Brachypodium distachyon TaxID=15368 RepID=A0A0Q3HS90_BRADI|nr:hypothetical protein BRADI_3g22765v3 [Brachypodium distachyon]